MLTLSEPKLIPQCHWLCNGGINPLIRTEQDLGIASRDDADFLEGVRYMRIHLECFHKLNAGDLALASTSEVCRKYFELRDRPPRREIGNTGCFSTAQLLAKHGNTDCRAQCANLRDLLACFKLMGSYNNFEDDKSSLVFERFNRLSYFGETNPNTGIDAFQYHFGWEGSHVVYIRYRNRYLNSVLTADWRHYEEYTSEQFTSDCERLGRNVDADECDLSDEDEASPEFRLWWD